MRLWLALAAKTEKLYVPLLDGQNELISIAKSSGQLFETCLTQHRFILTYDSSFVLPVLFSCQPNCLVEIFVGQCFESNYLSSS